MNDKIEKIIKAIEKNGYTVNRNKDVRKFGTALGILGRKLIKDPDYGDREKYLLHTQGSDYEKGYLTGLLAEPRIRSMAVDYVNNVVWAFFAKGLYRTNWWKTLTGIIIAFIVYLFSLRMRKHISKAYKMEMKGIRYGCREINRNTRVNAWRIWTLNTGVDALLSVIYTGKLGIFRPARLSKRFRIRIPVMCNAFSICGNLTEKNEHFWGRDFMFPTAGVFQLCATQIVHKPYSGDIFTGITAPGLAGLMTGMNKYSLAMGVNMVAGCNCRPRRPGMNSLLMVRHCIENAKTLEQAVGIIESTKRGVSWIYILAHGNSQTACVVEAGKTAHRGKFTRNLPLRYRSKLPSRDYIKNNLSTPFRRGIMVRYQGYHKLTPYQSFNQDLFTYFKKKHPEYSYKYEDKDFKEKGMLDKTWKDKNCPQNYYFNPQREYYHEMIIATNFFLIPEMKLYSMARFTNTVSKESTDDFQWRYDVLNKLLLMAVPQNNNGKKMSYMKARDIISFLDPKFKQINDSYYITKLGIKDHIPVQGSISICNLSRLFMETKIGYFKDSWIKLNLKDFLKS